MRLDGTQQKQSKFTGYAEFNWIDSSFYFLRHKCNERYVLCMRDALRVIEIVQNNYRRTHFGRRMLLLSILLSFLSAFNICLRMHKFFSIRRNKSDTMCIHSLSLPLKYMLAFFWFLFACEKSPHTLFAVRVCIIISLKSGWYTYNLCGD